MSEEAVKEIQREMLRKLRNDITDEQFDLMKKEIRQKELGGFGAGDIQRTIKTIDNLFDKLASKQIFKLGHYKKLHKLFRLIDADNHREIIKEAEMKLRAMHYPVEGEDISDSTQQVPQQGYHPAALHPWGYIPPGGTTYMSYAAPPHYPPQPQHMGGSQYNSQQFAEPRDPAVMQPNVAHPQPSSASRHDLRQPQSFQVPMSDSLPRGTSDSASGNKGFNHRLFYEPGKCHVLFINNIFTGRSNRRLGAETDEENVRGLFRDLGDNYSDLTYKKDVTKGELENHLRTSQSTLRKGEYKSFIFIIGTHGQPQRTKTDGPEKDGVLMADEKWMLVDDIINYFHGDKIPAMKDMPKIFIIQSCRGKEHVRGVCYADSIPGSSSKQVFDSFEIPGFLTRPVNSDVLIAYATTEGTKAWRDSLEGSWFVKDLCDVIAEFKDKEHILDILVRVNNRMVWRESSEGRAKQMPCFVCTFTRRFMFVL
ncbi:caspase-3-like [Diadema setosum]|uniref:caspase-3-like n=1 Tax=Diadema setosum TaxID=31175 RepID=UPI003B3B83B4